MPVITQATRKTDFVISCGVPGCTFKSSNRGIVANYTEEDDLLLAAYLDPKFVPSGEDKLRLEEILGNNLECPEHGRAHPVIGWKKILFQSASLVKYVNK